MAAGKIDKRLGRITKDFSKLSLEEITELDKEIWRKKMGTELDLEHLRTFNEKMQWYKLYYHHPDITRCIDKVSFKDYVGEKLGPGYTTKLLRVWESPEEISFDGLPDQFVVKSNASACGIYTVIVRDKAACDLGALAREIKDYWFCPLNLIINGFGSGSRGIIPKVLVEEYIDDPSGQVNDYKVFCFDGKPECFYVAKEHFTSDGKPQESAISFFDLDWKLLNVRYGNHPSAPDVPKPNHIEEMRDVSRILSKGFPYVRCDFYDTGEQIYVGEMTFYSGGGFTGFDPPEYDLYLGNLFKLNIP